MIEHPPSTNDAKFLVLLVEKMGKEHIGRSFSPKIVLVAVPALVVEALAAVKPLPRAKGAVTTLDHPNLKDAVAGMS